MIEELNVIEKMKKKWNEISYLSEFMRKTKQIFDITFLQIEIINHHYELFLVLFCFLVELVNLVIQTNIVLMIKNNDLQHIKHIKNHNILFSEI